MKTTSSILVTIAFLMFQGCEQLISVFWGGGQQGPITSYPLEIGNTWHYSRHMFGQNFRPLIPGAVDPGIDLWLSYEVHVNRRINIPRVPSGIADSIRVTELRHIEREGTRNLLAYLYLRQEPDGLYRHGYTGSTLGGPRPASTNELRYVLRGSTFESPFALVEFLTRDIPGDLVDSLIREYPPLKAVHYPLQYGDRWVFRGSGFVRIDKQTGPMMRTSVLGKPVRYHEVQWFYDLENNGTWDDDLTMIDEISDKGMIGRELIARDILVTDPIHPEGIGWLDIVDRFEITLLGVP
jgi:hypothetical protein